MLKLRFRTILVLGIGLLISGWAVYAIRLDPNALSIEVMSPEFADTYQVFYDIGQGFNEADSISTIIQPGNKSATLHFFEFPAQHIQAFRIDPGTRKAQIVIKSIRLQHEFHQLNLHIPLYTWKGDRLIKEFQPVDHISDFSINQQWLQLTSTGDDPNFKYQGDWYAVQTLIYRNAAHLKRLLYGLIILGFVGLALLYVLVILNTRKLSRVCLKTSRFVCKNIHVIPLLLFGALGGLGGFYISAFTGSQMIVEMKTSRSSIGSAAFSTTVNLTQWDILYTFTIYPPNEFHQYRFPLPTVPRIEGIRIDPMQRRGRVEIRSLSITNWFARYSWSGEKLHNKILPQSLHDMQFDTISSDSIGATITGHDPFFVISGIPEDCSVTPRAYRIFIGVLGFLATIMIMLAGKWAIKTYGVGFWFWAKVHPVATLAITGAIAAILSCYPVVFFGKSFVALYGAATVYQTSASLPGKPVYTQENTRGSDVGAMQWQNRTYSFVQGESIFTNGEIPLWNRYNSLGTPLLGQGLSMLGDPFHFLTIIARGSALAWDIYFVLAKILFCIGIGLLVLKSTDFLPAAMLLSVSSAFIGFFAFRLNHPGFFSISYAPWLLYALFGMQKANTRQALFRWGLLYIIAVLCLLNSGTVKEAYMLCIFLSLAGMFATIFAPLSFKARCRKLGAIVLFGIFAILITAPFWLIFADTLHKTTSLSSSPNLITADIRIVIGFFENIFFQIVTNAYVFLPATNFFILLGFLYAMFSLRELWKDSQYKATLIVKFIALSLAFGFVPADYIIKIPILNNVSHLHVTFSCVMLICACVLAGFGIKIFWQHCQQGRDIMTTIVSINFLMALLIAMLYYTILVEYRNCSLTVKQTSPFIAILFGASCLLPVIAMKAVSQHKLTIPVGAMILLCMGIIHVRHGMHIYLNPLIDHYVINPDDRSDFFAVSPAIETLSSLKGPPFRVIGLTHIMFPGYHASLKIEGINGPDPLWIPWYHEMLDAFNVYKPWEWRYEVRMTDLVNISKALDLLNVRYILAAPEVPRLTDDSARLVAQKDLAVFERPSAWPRAFFTNRVKIYDQVSEFVEMVNNAVDRPVAAVQRSEVSIIPQNMQRITDLESPPVTIPAVDYHLTTNHTEFTIRAPEAGIVVLTESYVPDDFIVTMNNKRVPYFRVNHAFKGIVLNAPGTYRIKFSYQPRLWYIALGLMGIGLFISLVISVRIFSISRKHSKKSHHYYKLRKGWY